jgi:inorganic triphosphatase YgiF
MAAAAGLAQRVSDTEVELKLLVAAADIPRLRRHPLLKTLRTSVPTTRKLHAIYFDTEDFFLKQNGVALRVRCDGRNWVQTVKGGGSVQAGLHQRSEWEARVAEGRPDFTKIADPEVAALFSGETLRQNLHPLFTTDFSRTVWLLKTDAGDCLELALDQGEIRAGQATSPISEVELELKAGNPAALYEMALALQQTVPLCAENASKAERGYALCAPASLLVAVKAVLPRLDREMTAGSAFRAIAWNCVDQLQSNQSLLRQGYDVECIHQIRVAVRRLRSAINLFAAVAPGSKDAALIEELRWFAGQLGPARDWDVFLSETLPPICAALPHEAGFGRLQATAVRRCGKKRKEALGAATSQRYHKLLLALGAWLWREPWYKEADAGHLGEKVGAFAARMLARRHRQILRRGRGFAGLTDQQRHALRISAKKLRYAAEFFSGLFPSRDMRRYLKSLAELQNGLGVLNDQAVAARLLTEIGMAGFHVAEVRAIGVVIGWCAGKGRCQVAGMARTWKRFERRETFWTRETE